MSIQRRAAVVLAVLIAVAGGCTAAGDGEGGETTETAEPLRLDWQELRLPTHPGRAGRLMLRDIATCAGRWYAVGGLAEPAGQTRPVAWTSTDGERWQALALTAKTYYGARNVLYSAACRDDGQVAVLGAKRGGAHANPRVSSWRQQPDGSLIEVSAPFELYGGPRAVDVARVSAGPQGWLISGNRTSGAAVWISADSSRFELIEAAPQLASDERGEPWAFDSVPVDAGWLLVGGIVASGRTERDPLAWTSPDGRSWQRVAVPATGEYDELQRVVLVNATPVAIGLRDGAFGAWRADRTGREWSVAGAFGDPAAITLPRIRGVAVAGDRLLVATSTGPAHDLWFSADQGRSWRQVSAPAPMPAGAEREVAVRASAGQVLLAVDDGQRTRVWRAGVATLPTVSD